MPNPAFDKRNNPNRAAWRMDGDVMMLCDECYDESDFLNAFEFGSNPEKLLELATEEIAKGENLKALEYLYEAFPNIVRRPEHVIDTVKCHGQKTFYDKMQGEPA